MLTWPENYQYMPENNLQAYSRELKKNFKWLAIESDWMNIRCFNRYTRTPAGVITATPVTRSLAKWNWYGQHQLSYIFHLVFPFYFGFMAKPCFSFNSKFFLPQNNGKVETQNKIFKEKPETQWMQGRVLEAILSFHLKLSFCAPWLINKPTKYFSDKKDTVPFSFTLNWKKALKHLNLSGVRGKSNCGWFSSD